MSRQFTFLDFEPFDPVVIQSALEEEADEVPVRRPFMGLEINRETYATLHVLFKDLDPIRLINSSSRTGFSTGTANFIITHVKHARNERVQISDTFRNLYLHTYGEQPKMLTVMGVLLKSKNFPWQTEWLENYERVLRASRTVEDAARSYLTVEDKIFEGHILASQVVDQAETPNQSPFQFSMILTNVIYSGTTGAAFDRPGTEGSIVGGGTRVSSSEYLRRGGDRPQNNVHSFDKYGNLVVENRDRLLAEEIEARLAEEEAINAFGHDLMERIIRHPLYTGPNYSSREERDAELVEYCRGIAADLLSDAEVAKDVFSAMSGWVNGADSGDQSARRSRIMSGQSFGGDGATSNIDTEGIISDERISEYARGAS